MDTETINNHSSDASGHAKATAESVETQPYDAIVIGAGLCGIIFLAYARENGLHSIALEKQSDVGGLWNRLPAWQDIQNRRQDIALDGIPLNGVDQPAIHEYAQEWVRRFRLDPYIRLGCEVSAVFRQDGEWKIHTKQGEVFRTKFLLVASGVQNEPWLPNVERTDSAIEEVHSSSLFLPQNLSGQRVTVVGGAASSQDLLELALRHGAKDIHWVYHKQLKWFIPTHGPKQQAWPNLRELSLGQSLHGTAFASTLMRRLLRYRYDHYGIAELVPDEAFDFDKHQLIPGRALLLRKLDTVSRHKAEIRSMHGQELTLTNGERFETDRVLWGTGYRMNLRFLGLPEYRQLNNPAQLLPKLGSLVRSLDYPDMFFLGMTLINSTSSTPFLAAVEAKTIISHIQGKCVIPDKVLPHHLTYWELIHYFASFDRANYPKWWKFKYIWLSLWYAALQNRSMRV